VGWGSADRKREWSYLRGRGSIAFADRIDFVRCGLQLALVRTAAQNAGHNRWRHNHRYKCCANQNIEHGTLSYPIQIWPNPKTNWGLTCGKGIGREQESGIATRWDRGGSLVAGLRSVRGRAIFSFLLRTLIGTACGNHRQGHGRLVAAHRRSLRRAATSPQRAPYASSSISRCGMAATIAGQATMATKARATRMSCIADSLKDSRLWPSGTGVESSYG